MREVWFTVEHATGNEWHLWDGPFPSMRQARKARDDMQGAEMAGMKEPLTLRVVEHRVRD